MKKKWQVAHLNIKGPIMELPAIGQSVLCQRTMPTILDRIKSHLGRRGGLFRYKEAMPFYFA